MRVMIVDDEQPCLDEMVYMLSRCNDVEIAGAYTRPAEALEAAERSVPDALFLDLFMPKMTGAELAGKILARHPAARLIFVTAYARELAAVKDIPAVGSLLKPVADEKLDEMLARLRASPPA